MLDIRFILYPQIFELDVQVTKKMAESLPGGLVGSRKKKKPRPKPTTEDAEEDESGYR